VFLGKQTEWTILDSTGQYWTILDNTGKYWTEDKRLVTYVLLFLVQEVGDIETVKPLQAVDQAEIQQQVLQPQQSQQLLPQQQPSSGADRVIVLMYGAPGTDLEGQAALLCDRYSIPCASIDALVQVTDLVDHYGNPGGSLPEPWRIITGTLGDHYQNPVGSLSEPCGFITRTLGFIARTLGDHYWYPVGSLLKLCGIISRTLWDHDWYPVGSLLKPWGIIMEPCGVITRTLWLWLQQHRQGRRGGEQVLTL